MRITCKAFLLLLSFALSVRCAHAQTDSTLLETDTIPLGTVIIESTRADQRTPVAYTELSTRDIAPLNTGQDMPSLLRFTPSLVTTSDAGNGIGYSGLWIRGSDPSRINVTINGVPLNDPESQQVFWVNTPDLGSNANSIQVQRGIGTSANGAASFGGSIKVETRALSSSPYAEITNGYGSFNTWKNTVAFGSGTLNERYTIEGRLSRIASDGYVDRASTNLKSFYLEGNYITSKTTIKLLAFGGREETYQSWNGTPWERLYGNDAQLQDYISRNGLTDAQANNLLSSDRTYNFYEYQDQNDVYGQDHFQAHLTHFFSRKLRLNVSGHFTHGEGYFEEFKEDQGYEDYGLVAPAGDSSLGIFTTDLVRRRWLKNNFYGTVFSLDYKKGIVESTIGGAWNEYDGTHFGEITWMEFAGPTFIGTHYYDGESRKRDANLYFKNIVTLRSRIDLYLDVQLRNVDYTTSGNDNELRPYNITDNLVFFNPKAGVNYRPNDRHRIYLSVARGAKEPNRNDYIDAPDPSLVKPEEMTDIEAGHQWSSPRLRYGVNGYYMNYVNQLVLTGELNDVGAPLRINVPSSYRRGIELEAAWNFHEGFLLGGNVTLSQNKIKTFNEILYDYTVDYDVLSVKHEDTDISFSPSVISAMKLQYTFGRNEKTRIGSGAGEYSITWYSKYVGKQYLDNTQHDTRSLDSYLVQDVSFGYDLQWASRSGITVQFVIQNVLNEFYSSNGYTYSYIAGDRITERFYFPQAGRNYMLNLSVRIR